MTAGRHKKKTSTHTYCIQNSATAMSIRVNITTIPNELWHSIYKLKTNSCKLHNWKTKGHRHCSCDSTEELGVERAHKFMGCTLIVHPSAPLHTSLTCLSQAQRQPTRRPKWHNICPTPTVERTFIVIKCQMSSQHESQLSWTEPQQTSAHMKLQTFWWNELITHSKMGVRTRTIHCFLYTCYTHTQTDTRTHTFRGSPFIV